MRERADKSAKPRGRIELGDMVPYGLIVVAVLLAWQITIQPLAQRAPARVAISLAPGSPTVLRRAAEAELAAGRTENAASLSRDALVRSPFDVRALRVVGLTEAHAGREDQADEILTLAGNWSLRDDPAHAWLVERRLRRGDYASSFAHADTLVRRRQDIRPQVFRLFTVSGTEDPQRSLPVIASLLDASPPWRGAYLVGLNQTPQELQLAANLAILLESGRAPFGNDELRALYVGLLEQRQYLALDTVRARINRPPAGVAVANSGFGDMSAPEPFQWRLYQKAGISTEIVGDDLRPHNPALRVAYNGFAAGTVIEQLTSLAPGTYRLAAEVRIESGGPETRLAWTLSCATGGSAFASVPTDIPGDTAPNTWTTTSHRFEVPNNCPAQWLRLETRAGDYRAPTVVWFDRIVVSRAN